MCLAGALSLLDMGRSERPQKEAGWQDKRMHSGKDYEKRQPSSRILTLATAKPGASANSRPCQDPVVKSRVGC